MESIKKNQGFLTLQVSTTLNKILGLHDTILSGVNIYIISGISELHDRDDFKKSKRYHVVGVFLESLKQDTLRIELVQNGFTYQRRFLRKNLYHFEHYTHSYLYVALKSGYIEIKDN